MKNYVHNFQIYSRTSTLLHFELAEDRIGSDRLGCDPLMMGAVRHLSVSKCCCCHVACWLCRRSPDGTIIVSVTETHFKYL